MLQIKGFTPYGFQEKTIKNAISIVQQYGGCCIFDETGLGKTITGAHIAINVGQTILVVSPKANQKSWAAVLPQATICTKQKIASGIFDVVVVDEAHNFNKPSNKSFKDLLDVVYFQSNALPKVILLTATPVNNNVEELFNMFRLIPFPANSSAFYTVPVVANAAIKAEIALRKFEKALPSTGIYSFKQFKTLEDLEKKLEKTLEVFGGIIKEFCLRNTRDLIAANFAADMETMGHFPKIEHKDIKVYSHGYLIESTIELIEKMPFAYYNVLQYVQNPVQSGMGGIMKTLLLKRLDSSIAAFKETLQKIKETFGNIETSGVVHIDNTNYFVSPKFYQDLQKDLETLDTLERVWGGMDDSQKLNQLIMAIKQVNGKVVVFTEYLATQKVIVDALQDYNVLSYNGKDDDKILETIAQEFDRNIENPTNNYQILVVTDALSEGVNLHIASTLIHYDLKWNPSRLIQREGRVNRLVKKGLVPNNISVLTFGVQSLVEAVVKLEQRIVHKRNLADLILNSTFTLQYIQNVLHSNYYFQRDWNFSIYFGIRFDKGVVFFEIGQIKGGETKVCGLVDLPQVRAKKISKVQNYYPKALFNYSGPNVSGDLGQYIFKNPLFGPLVELCDFEGLNKLLLKFACKIPENVILDGYIAEIEKNFWQFK